MAQLNVKVGGLDLKILYSRRQAHLAMASNLPILSISTALAVL